jgi:hypothetical protein
MMKLNKFMSIIAVVVFAFSLSSCNKPAEPIVLTGSWQLDTSLTFMQVIYNPASALEYPNALKYLKDNWYKILKEIKTPPTIQFVEPNVVNFIYSPASTPTVIGSFVQYEIYVTITNSLFPNSITGASNNQKLELYYGKSYMMGILNSMLTPADDAPENFSKLVDQFDGVGVYVRAQ